MIYDYAHTFDSAFHFSSNSHYFLIHLKLILFYLLSLQVNIITFPPYIMHYSGSNFLMERYNIYVQYEIYFDATASFSIIWNSL